MTIITKNIAALALFFVQYSVVSYRIPGVARNTIALRMKNENPEDGYGPMGSLLRQGPVPFFIRIVKPDTYEAAVQKYMKLEKCSKIEAQANMDAYFQDPNGWAGAKLRQKNTGQPAPDYINVGQDPQSLILTAIWAIGIISLFWRIFQIQVLEK
jgi:hypothetical protein